MVRATRVRYERAQAGSVSSGMCPHPPPGAAVQYVEVKLTWLIERAGLTTPRPDRRLNGIENLAASVTRPWRNGAQPIAVEAELRLSAATCAVIRSWVEASERATGPTAARLRAYARAPVADPTVPEGWVRVLLQARARL